MIDEVSSKPFGVNPQIMMSIIKGLYSLKPGLYITHLISLSPIDFMQRYNIILFAEFSERNPMLFARFIPNILPPTQCDQLPSLIQEDRLLQEDLVTSQGFSR